MKKCFTILLALVATGIVNGQSFYFKAGAGHSFSSASQSQGINSSALHIKETDPVAGHYVSSVALRYSEVKGSLGSGLTFTSTLGMELNRNIAFEIRFDYVDGKEFTTTDYNADITDGATVNSSTNEFRRYANSFQVSPIVSFFPDLKSIRPYLSAGPVFSHVNVYEEELSLSNYEGDNFQNYHKEIYGGGIAIGITGSAGIEKSLSPHLSVFAECTYVSLSYFPQEGEIVSYEVNNEDRLSTLDAEQRKTVFVDEYLVDSRNPFDRPDQPGKAIRFSFPLSRITATAGLKVKVFTRS